MADSGDGKPLLGGNRREKRPGTAEENSFQLSGYQLIQQRSAQHNGTASASGTAGTDILSGVVKNHGAAVGNFSAQGNPVSACKLH